MVIKWTHLLERCCPAFHMASIRQQGENDLEICMSSRRRNPTGNQSQNEQSFSQLSQTLE